MPTIDLGPQLARLRRRRGLSQQQLADQLCAISGSTTLSRNEISRWERGRRVPAQPWLGWLEVVLKAQLGRQHWPPRQPHPDRQTTRRWRALRSQLAAARQHPGRTGVWVVIPEVEAATTID